jgi:hypothetical protein
MVTITIKRRYRPPIGPPPPTAIITGEVPAA